MTWATDLKRVYTDAARETTTEAAREVSWDSPGAMAVDLDDNTIQTPALEAIDQFLVDIASTPDARGIIIMPPQEGKSQRASRRFPAWVLHRNPDTKIAIASYAAGVARRWGRTLRDDVRLHEDVLGLRIRSDLSGQTEWQLAGAEGGVYTVGIGGSLTSKQVDLMLIDDPIKDRKQAESQVSRDAVWDWWTDVVSTRLSPGAPVVLILTRWHDDDLAGRLLAAEDGHRWKVLHIPAQADHRPEDGEADPLGREPGEFMISARGRTVEQWEAIKIQAGSRTWAALYQGRPRPDDGDVINPGWYRFWSSDPRHATPDGRTVYVTPEELMGDRRARWLESWDLAFKGTDGSDFVVGQRWCRRGVERFLMGQVRARLTFTRTKAAMLDWADPEVVGPVADHVHLRLVEDKANGPAVIDELKRAIPGLVGVNPGSDSKTARAMSTTPEIEAGNVLLPDPRMPGFEWVNEFLEEVGAFPNGVNDDQVDGQSQALIRFRSWGAPAAVVTVAGMNRKVLG